MIGAAVVLEATAQSEWLVPSEYITLDGVPKIPASLAKVTDGFRTVFNDSLIGWDPVKVAPVILRKGYADWTVGRVEIPGGAPRGKVPGSTYDVYTHPGGKYLLFRVDAANENYQFYRSNPGTSEPTLITDGKSINL